ncbi:unnamed protein product [Prorocentrum cordatum]|uniref:Methyltransferase type 11 domain-containing protein n=1 Tax=Prorocentrum cordatum TaxID=2364126 RepID=A0ABN9X5P4_9DINO|nr:unnamed protein product [Polarella glacialis]
MWTREYSPGGAWQFWSLGRPKKEIVRLVEDASFPADGLSAVVLGCGVGVEVDYLARRAGAGAAAAAAGMAARAPANCVAGVDFALPAVQRARDSYGATDGAFFHHADVLRLPAPRAPLDLVVDNTVLQNVLRGEDGDLDRYLGALRRISLPGHTVLNVNLMSQEGFLQQPGFAECGEALNLPLVRAEQISAALGGDWEVLDQREGLYDLSPEAVGIECEAFYEFGGSATPGIPSHWLLLRRRAGPEPDGEKSTLWQASWRTVGRQRLRWLIIVR